MWPFAGGAESFQAPGLKHLPCFRGGSLPALACIAAVHGSPSPAPAPAVPGAVRRQRKNMPQGADHLRARSCLARALSLWLRAAGCRASRSSGNARGARISTEGWLNLYCRTAEPGIQGRRTQVEELTGLFPCSFAGLMRAYSTLRPLCPASFKRL